METRSVEGLYEELSTELTPLLGKKATFRDALKTHSIKGFHQ